MNDVFLHNPRCSKSRAALELVHDAGVRRAEPQYAALGLSDTTPDEEVLRAMAEHPILIERPIVVRNGRAVIGRPTETVRDIL